MGKKDGCAVFGHNNDSLYQETYSEVLFLPKKHV